VSPLPGGEQISDEDDGDLVTPEIEAQIEAEAVEAQAEPAPSEPAAPTNPLFNPAGGRPPAGPGGVAGGDDLPDPGSPEVITITDEHTIPDIGVALQLPDELPPPA